MHAHTKNIISKREWVISHGVHTMVSRVDRGRCYACGKPTPRGTRIKWNRSLRKSIHAYEIDCLQEESQR